MQKHGFVDYEAAGRMGKFDTMTEALELDDVQGLVVRGYVRLTSACYILIEVVNPGAARTWLGALASELNTSASRPSATAINVAFTRAGLTTLGLPVAAVRMFSLEFIDGMVDPHRSRILGDLEESAPEYWDWGGPCMPGLHALLLLFASGDEQLEQLATEQIHRFQDSGLRQLARLDTSYLGLREQFGFRDGISQPTIDGLGYSDTSLNTVQPGEFVLGYPNERGQFAPSPTIAAAQNTRGLLRPGPGSNGQPDFGRNGAYLVFRQLRQDVRGFWGFAERATRHPDGSADEAKRNWLAAKMVGRWPSGAPLVKAPEQDDPALASDNDFAYAATDLYGYRCHVGAHIRRGNPRDSLDPAPGSEQSITIGKHHRLIRRGREYGPPVDPATLFTSEPSNEDDVGRGLHFVCLCADIARQFEFVQHTWLMSTKFSGLYDDADPLLGAPSQAAGTFTVQADPLRHRYSGLSRFVTVRGGAYFFLPGIRATRYLASLSS
jgi:Dyp-type peroxidase family